MTSAAQRTAFINGAFVPFAEARVSVMDRGFLFADSIYEVSAVIDGGLVDNAAHLARLERSLGAIGIADPHDLATWEGFQRELIERDGLRDGTVYIQVSRGVAERDFGFAADLAPSVVMFTQHKKLIDLPAAATGVAVATAPDIRWGRRDIKSTGLLAQVLAKRGAAEAGAAEVFMVEDGFVTEGGSSTAFIVTRDGTLVTRPLSNAILPGITRRAIMRLAEQDAFALVERPFTVAEAHDAAEVFFTSASTFVMPVIALDGKPVGDGRPGRLARRLRQAYIDTALGDMRR